MSQTVFKRYEEKYLLTTEQEEKLLEGLEGHMSIDKYGETTICNIYFDTDDFDLIRRSIEGPVYKEKLRLRSYGVPKDDGATVFVEIKKKFEGVVYKRRVAMTLAEAECYLYDGIHPDDNSQIIKEIDWFLRMNPVTPQVYLAYDRRAFAADDGSELRLTLDRNIRCRRRQLKLGDGSVGERLLPPDTTLMEIKIPGIMPKWMAHLLSELKIYPVSFSKYGCYYRSSSDIYTTVLDNHRALFDVDNPVVSINAIRTHKVGEDIKSRRTT